MSIIERVEAAKVGEDIHAFNAAIDRIEERCMATDGPVTPTLQEMREDELADIWARLQRIRARLQRVSGAALRAMEARAIKENDHA